MSAKDQFTDSEWESVIQAPMLAGIAVTAADPGGIWAAIKEGSAIARSLVEAKQSTEAGTLLKEKEYLRATAQRVAESAKEGGFLGFGGEKVSDAEKKTLADLDRVLS